MLIGPAQVSPTVHIVLCLAQSSHFISIVAGTVSCHCDFSGEAAKVFGFGRQGV